MKKIFIVALAIAMIGGLQSCKKSPDSNAKDYCATVKTLLENRDLEKLQEYNAKAQEYMQGLNEQEQTEFMQGIQKYQVEYKLDSIYGHVMQEQASQYAGGAQTPAQGQVQQAPAGDVDTIDVTEQEEVVEEEAAPAKAKK